MYADVIILSLAKRRLCQMPVRYKIDVLEALRAKGYSSYRIRKEKLLSERTIQALREGRGISFESLGRICEMLDCDIPDILIFKQGDN